MYNIRLNYTFVVCLKDLLFKKQQLNALLKDREEHGVQLYTIQQNLVKQQLSLEVL